MKKATPNDESSPLLNSKDTSVATQRNQILEFRKLGFISPAPRIKELKEHGHNIKSTRETVTTDDGRTHRGIARYYLSQLPQPMMKIARLQHEKI